MKPDDIWVIFNKVSCEILFLYAERFMAERKADQMSENVTGTIPNSQKILIITLQRALDEIQARHLEELSESDREKTMEEIEEDAAIKYQQARWDF